VDKPPDLLGLDLLSQRNALIEGWVNQTYNLHSCNADKEGLRNWKSGQKEVFDGGP
jgi:hypothetical protein